MSAKKKHLGSRDASTLLKVSLEIQLTAQHT